MSELSRLRWRCRRGTTELDRLLGRFLEAENNGYQALDAHGRAAFEQLLACEDDCLIDWLLSGHTPPELRFVDVVSRVRSASGL